MQKGSLVSLTIFVVVAVMFTKLPPMVAEQDSVARTYSTLVEVDALARKHFVQLIENDRLVDGAIRGMMLQLDPYSAYLTAEDLALHQQRQSGAYVGIGIELGVQHGELTVIAPVDGGPAEQAGVRPGDVILAINDADARTMSVFAANELLTGREHENVNLRLRSRGEDEPRTLTIARAPVNVRTVTGWARRPDGSWDCVLDQPRGVAYLRITRFAEHTYAEFTEALDEVIARGATGLVLDLRSNPGGLVQQAVAVLDRLVSDGVLVSTVSRRSAVQEFRATGANTVADLPLVVLIDGASASAAEIVSGSLQDHKRAVIVGRRSFGKGSVQQLIHLSEHGAAVKLTTAYYRLPGGRIIHRGPHEPETGDWGVKPDVIAGEEHTHATRPQRDQADPAIQAALTVLDGMHADK